MSNGNLARTKSSWWAVVIGVGWAAIVVGIFAFVGWSFLSGFPTDPHFGSYNAPTAKSSGPSRPLSEILGVAQEEARKVDQKAVLGEVMISPVGFADGVSYSGPTTGSLELSFFFARSIVEGMDLHMEDADPRSTVRISILSGYKSPSTGENMYKYWMETEQELIDSLLAYKLTSRDAVAITWQDSRDYVIKKGLATERVLPLIRMDKSESGTPVWTLDYWHTDDNYTSGDVVPLVSYVVDGLTGEITSSEYSVAQPPPTGNR